MTVIGFVEGGYNHLFRNAVYFGADETAARSIFPPSTYEMPNDLFEATGIAQFFVYLPPPRENDEAAN